LALKFVVGPTVPWSNGESGDAPSDEVTMGDEISGWRRWLRRRPATSDDGPRLRASLGRIVGAYCDLDLGVAHEEATPYHVQLGRIVRRIWVGTEESSAQPVEGQELAALESAFTQHRRAEQRFVARSISSFRRALLDVADGLSRAVEGDRPSDARVAATMESLRKLAQGPTTSLERLRYSVFQAVEVVETAAREREQRHDQEIKRLNRILEGMQIDLRRAQHEAQVDGLTGLANRATFDSHLAATAAIDSARGTRSCLMLIDLDHFKAINDTHGHQAGDAVLRAVAATLRDVVLRGTDLVARYGGEEFAIVLHDCTERGAVRVAERIRAAIADVAVARGGAALRITASIGVAERLPDEAEESWLARADGALYAAKEAGRDRTEAAA